MEQQKAQNLSVVIENNPEGEENGDDELEKLLQTSAQRTYFDGRIIVKYRGYWCPRGFLGTILSLGKQFKANDTDIVLASMPKAGTTWLKALTFSIVTRKVYPIDQSPLLTSNPHTLVPYLEFDLSCLQENCPNDTPRVLSTHLSFKTLPESILQSKCKILYICRNPLDLFVSLHNFLNRNKATNDAAPLDLDEGFDMFCQGIHYFGPFWEQMLEYWTAHLENPNRVLFLKYEDLREHTALYLRKIAEHIGFPFSAEEEEEGLVERILSLCSLEKLSSLEVNKTGAGNITGLGTALNNSSFFRKGLVGGWANHLTPAMAARLKKLMEIKFQSSGLTLKI